MLSRATVLSAIALGACIGGPLAGQDAAATIERRESLMRPCDEVCGLVVARTGGPGELDWFHGWFGIGQSVGARMRCFCGINQLL